MTPAWLLDIFAAIMLAVAAVSAARLIAALARRHGAGPAGIDIAHLLMGVAMAGMLASGLTTLPNTAWEVIFGLLTAWFVFRVVTDARAHGTRALAGGHCAPHLVHSAAMLYMFLAVAAPAAGGMGGMSGMSGMSGSGMPVLEYPTLALVFTLVLAGYSIWDIDQGPGSREGGATADGPVRALLAPGAATGCRIAMGVTMAFMLIIMI